MTEVSAEASGWLKIRTQDYSHLSFVMFPFQEPKALDAFHLPQSLPALRVSRPLVAPWLSNVKRRINDSITPSGREESNEGQWISGEIAEVAKNFFEAVSDVLPGEPEIYNSGTGDLVAEFKASHGSLTTILSRTSLVLFAASDSSILERTLPLGRANSAALRKVLDAVKSELESKP